MYESDLDIFISPPVLSTERLLLRKLAISDYKDMYEYSKLPETSRFLLWSPHETPRFTKKYLSYLQGEYRGGRFYDFAVVEKKSGKMIGTCGFTSIDLVNNGAEVGYVLSPAHWGKGYGAEALRCVMRFGFSELGVHRMEAKIMEGNTASMRVAEKCGMRREAVHRDAMLIKGAYRTIVEYAVLAEEFRAH